MSQDFEAEFLKGLELAMRGKHVEAIEAFERSSRLNRYALDPALNLLESYMKVERTAEADALADELLKLWPNEQAALVSVAELREAQGRPDEALKLILDRHVDSTINSLAYPAYLRLLLENEQYDEAMSEAEAALQSPTLWTPYAMLARIIALLHFKEYEMLQRRLAEFDVEEFADLVDDTAARMKQAGALDQAKRLFADARRHLPHDETLKKLSARFDV
ncbi:MAG TPA: tetratricopeptide repeat protein [Pyrinomonadaceae bacterium]|nr:tetratricopeptide repeat protein [Pyrinomonadaceae bacterium]